MPSAELLLATAVGWTILHSLWEGAIAALLLGATLVAVRRARVRYACACGALALIAVSFAFTLYWYWPGVGQSGRVPHGMLRGSVYGPEMLAGAAGERLMDVLPWLAPCWLAGVLFFQVRSLAGWTAVRRLRRRGVCIAPEAWRLRLRELGGRLGVREKVALLETSLARTPVAIGYLKPAILMPAGLLAGMPTQQVEAILLHELAHILRGDYLVNLLQTVVEGFLFYHPATWWISRVIRTEREDCCDDLAVRAMGDAHAYASALAALEETRMNEQAALAATGGDLVNRIRRVLYGPPAFGSALAALAFVGLLLVAAAGGLAAWQANAPAPAVSPMAKWVQEDVTYIINDQERAAFERLQSDPEREHFIEQFWERRNPTPGSADNALKVEHYRRIAYDNRHFAPDSGKPGWTTDRGRVYIVYGPPDEIESHPHGRSGGGPEAGLPQEAWRYRHLQGIGNNVIVEFVDRNRNGDFPMTSDPHPPR